MSAAAKAPAKTEEAASEESGDGAPKRGRKKLIILIAVPLLLGGVGAGLWFSGLLNGLLGKAEPQQAAAEAPAAGASADGAAAPGSRQPPVFLAMPDIVANLNVGNRRVSFVKLRSKLELARAEDKPVVEAAMPRLQDLFTTYLRELRPEELRGSAGTYRLREELLARANVAAAPARVIDVLFIEILQQ